jgi:prephenate dehydrogenase
MAGKETASIDAAEATLFKDKPYVLIPSPDASEAAVQAVNGLINSVGGKALFLDAEEHDQFAAAISHLPIVVSTALFTLARSSLAWQDLSKLSGSGFRDMTRLASGDPTMSHDIALTNRDAIIHWLDRYMEELSRYRELLQEGKEGSLFEQFSRTQLDREAYINRTERHDEGPMPEIPPLNDQLAAMLVGERLVQRMRDIGKLISGETPREPPDSKNNGGPSR